MAVVLLSPDPDLRELLTFLLRYHKFRVTIFDPCCAADATAPALLLVDLIDVALAPRTAASAALYAAGGPLLALCRPGAGLEQARALLPQAAAYLPAPIIPQALVAQVRALLPRDAVVGYGRVALSTR